MARLARVVVPGMPHHVTQRGNGRAKVFFRQADYGRYRDLLAEACRDASIKVWAWVLMPNHVHLILQPADPDGLRRCLARVHRRYAGEVHARLKRTGHFWQGRYGSVVMDEPHLLAAIRYVLVNPVRAGMVANAADWRWSSAQAHLGLRTDDGLTDTALAAALIPDFHAFLNDAADHLMTAELRRAESTGRPIGSLEFLKKLETRTGRSLAPGKPGRKRRRDHNIDALSP